MKLKLTTLQTILKNRKITLSEYYGFPREKYRREFTESMLVSLMQHRVVERTEQLNVGGEDHLFHVYVLAGSAAIIYRGVDDHLLPVPILCRDAEALCFELLEWRARVGLEPVQKKCLVNSRMMTDEDLDNIAQSLVEARKADVFVDQIGALCERLEAVALCES